MGSQFLDYLSPRGAHVPETYANNADIDPYRRDSVHSPRKNRYSRSVHQTPRVRDVTWISSPDPTPQTPSASQTPWSPHLQAPSSPGYRPPSVIPPSPAPTVGEHMTVDDILFAEDGITDLYAYKPPQRGSGGSLFKSLWNGLKKLSGYQPIPYTPQASSYANQTVEMPAPILGTPSEPSQYVHPTPPGTRGATPYTSPYTQPTNLGVTPALVPGSSRVSRVSRVETPPPAVTVVSPSNSIPASPVPDSVHSLRVPSPIMRAPRNPLVGGLVPVAPVMPLVEEGSQTLHEPIVIAASPPFPTVFTQPTNGPRFPTSSGAPALESRSASKGSPSSPMACIRRVIAELDGLPWVSESHIADEYVPERTPRSQLRKRVRQGTEPSWYNARPEVEERAEEWAEWDLWANQATAALWPGVGEERVGWGGSGPWGAKYPQGYVPMQPGLMYVSGYPPPGMVGDYRHAPVIP